MSFLCALSNKAPLRLNCSKNAFLVSNWAAREKQRSYLSRRDVSTKPAYEGHVPLNALENAFLAVGSGLVLLTNPNRADLVAALGETTAIGPVLPKLRDRMLDSAEGRRVLKTRPRINTRSVDMQKLALLPENTLGRTYVKWLERCEVTPDSREPVHYIDDPELAYVMQRYRECHDLYHASLGMPVDGLSELAVKAFEFANLGLPMAALSALFGPLRLSSKRKERYYKEFLPWALRCGGSAQSMITVFWEERWSQDIDELRRELGIIEPPPVTWKKSKAIPMQEPTQGESNNQTIKE